VAGIPIAGAYAALSWVAGDDVANLQRVFDTLNNDEMRYGNLVRRLQEAGVMDAEQNIVVTPEDIAEAAAQKPDLPAAEHVRIAKIAAVTLSAGESAWWIVRHKIFDK
jgi:hypothetical protein